MAPEYGATIGYFPVDHQTVSYLQMIGCEPERIELITHYLKT